MKPETSKKVLKGKVVSTAMSDTAVVAVERFTKMPKYGKYRKVTKRYKVHDPGNTVSVGDTVHIGACRPISKEKHFIVMNTS